MIPRTTAIYARVSTGQQSTDMQLAELRQYVEKRGWVLYREYVDNGYTGSDTRRPAFNQMIEDARRRRFDLLLVWKLDRLSRSLRDLVGTLEELGSIGVDFVSFGNALDTSTPSGKLLLHVLAAFSEFERDIIRERVKAGLENAKRKGKRLGRPPISDEIFDKAERMLEQGSSIRRAAAALRIDEGTIRKRIKLKVAKQMR
jgi:DNA invertase Pin-like site-specific DNA recombinase